MIIDKTHSKHDLIDLINTLNLKIIFSHVDIKKNIHDKFYDMLKDQTLQKIIFDDNVYNVKNISDLRIYLKKPNPKKYLSVKEKNDIMKICKHIISYCTSGYNFDSSYKYDNIRQIEDDMHYIKQFGDIPSVRRCCKLLNKNIKQENHYIPVISPQVQKHLNDKLTIKKPLCQALKVHTGDFIIHFN